MEQLSAGQRLSTQSYNNVQMKYCERIHPYTGNEEATPLTKLKIILQLILSDSKIILQLTQYALGHMTLTWGPSFTSHVFFVCRFFARSNGTMYKNDSRTMTFLLYATLLIIFLLA